MQANAPYTCDVTWPYSTDEPALKSELRKSEDEMRAAMADLFELLPSHIYDDSIKNDLAMKVPADFIRAVIEMCSPPIGSEITGRAAPLHPEVLGYVDQFKVHVTKMIAPLVEILPPHLINERLAAVVEEVPERFAKAMRPFFVRLSHAFDLRDAYGNLALRRASRQKPVVLN